jgi:hypothetical protein
VRRDEKWWAALVASRDGCCSTWIELSSVPHSSVQPPIGHMVGYLGKMVELLFLASSSRPPIILCSPSSSPSATSAHLRTLTTVSA